MVTQRNSSATSDDKRAPLHTPRPPPTTGHRASGRPGRCPHSAPADLLHRARARVAQARKLTVREVRTWLNGLRNTCQCCAQGKDKRRAAPKCCAAGQCCRQFASERTIRDAWTVLRASLNNAVREELISRNVAALIRGKTWTSQARNLRSGGRYNASTVSYSIGRPRPEASDAPLPLVPREGRLSRATSTGASPPLARARRSPACGHAGAQAQSDLSDHEHLQRGLIGCRPPRAQAAWQAARHREVAVPCCCTTAKRAGCKITTGP